MKNVSNLKKAFCDKNKRTTPEKRFGRIGFEKKRKKEYYKVREIRTTDHFRSNESLYRTTTTCTTYIKRPVHQTNTLSISLSKRKPIHRMTVYRKPFHRMFTCLSNKLTNIAK
jgi:hypothetical protein